MNTLKDWCVIAVQWTVENHELKELGGGEVDQKLLLTKANKSDLAFLRDLCNKVLIKLNSNGRVGVGIKCLVYLEPSPKMPMGLRQSAAV